MKNVIITILSVLVVGLSAFIVVKSVENKGIIENKNEVKEVDMDDAQKLIERYYHTQFLNFFNGEFDEETKTLISILASDMTSISTNGLDEFECSTEGFDYVDDYHCRYKKNTYLYLDYNAKGVSYNSLNKKYKDLFGNDRDISKNIEDLTYLCTQYVYSSKIDSFIELLYIPCGVTGGPRYDLYSIDTIDNGKDKLVITIYYMETDGYSFKTNSGTYENILETESNTINNLQGDKLVYLPSIVNRYTNLLIKYKYEYKNEDGMYKLINIVKE